MKSHCIDLSRHANAHAATFDTDRAAGFVNAWGNSFPAEEVPYGRAMLVGGVIFELPEKQAARPDHVETLGQCIDTWAVITARSIGVLGFGELGDQSLALTLTGRYGERCRVAVNLPNWLVPRNVPLGRQGWRASHLHYAAGYELDHLCPVMFGVATPLPAAIQPVAVTVGANPLAHVVALTLLGGEGGHG
jgi:hypothetical protein